ncbi:putative ABC transporter ATP-binding protein YheS [compost metagenome]
MIILDEPTNNLDLQNVEILTNSIKDYHGTLLVISHDEVFLEQIGVDKEIVLQ